MEEALDKMVGCLRQTLNQDRGIRKQAEDFLQSNERNPGYALLLLTAISEDKLPLEIRMAASVAFKNFVKHNWRNSSEDTDECQIPESDRVQVKREIVRMMLESPDAVRKQLSEAITIIGQSDFPAQWADLLPNLTANMDSTDARIVGCCLETAHALFKRYRYEMKSETLWSEIKYVLDRFAAPLTLLFQNCVQVAKQKVNEPKEGIRPLVDNLTWIAKVFHSLNAQDLPEYFEDHMKEWMSGFLELLSLSPPSLHASDTEEAGPTEQMRAAICHILTMYAQKYDEEFAAFIPPFVEVVWQMLVTTGSETRYDQLVSTGIHFLASVCQREQYKGLFEAELILRQLCEKVIIPNMAFREVDLEMFEDNPDEFIRCDIEGSDVDTRRRAAADLVKALCRFFEVQVIQIFSGYIQLLFREYNANPGANWSKKDACVYLVMALSTRGETARLGATKTSELVNLTDFYDTHIFPDLAVEPIDSLPVLKAGSLKYLVRFRSQLTREQLLRSIDRLAMLLGAQSVVVRTYACHCLERILILKETQGTVSAPLIKRDEITSRAAPLTTTLLQTLQMNGTHESEYVVKAIMRLMTALQENLTPYRPAIVQRLTAKLMEVAKNPNKPMFNHYLFECYCVVIKRCSPEEVASIETELFPPFQAILQQDVMEFLPYVFQILGMMLDKRAANAGVPDTYMALFRFLLMPPLWERSANIPGLVRLLQAYVKVGSEQVVSSGHLNGLLGIFQLLAASKRDDHEGFRLIDTALEYFQWGHLEPHMKGVLMICFNRLQTSRTVKFAKGLVVFLCLIAVRQGATELQKLIESIQAGMYQMVVEKIIIKELQKVADNYDKKICCVGVSKMLTETADTLLASQSDLWAQLLQSLVAILELPEDANEVDDQFLDLPEQGYSAAYSQLAFASRLDTDPTGVQNVRAYLAKSLEALSTRVSADVVRSNVGKMETGAQQFLGGYLQAAGVQIK